MKINTKLWIFLILFLSGNIANSQWMKIGFDGRTVTSVSSNQINGNIFTVVDNKLYRTANNGQNWEKLDSGLKLLNILKVEVDIDSKIYVGTNSGIYLSIDNGVTFQSLNNNLPNDFGLFPAVSSICCLNKRLFIGTSSGVYTSKRNSINWQPFNNNLPLEQAKRIMVFFNNTLYIAMNSGIYKSSQDSCNWRRCYSGKTSDLAIVGNDLYASVAVGSAPVFKSSDFGETWLSAGYSNNYTGLSIYSFGNSIWVGTFYGSGIFSTDWGKSWSNLDIGPWTTVLFLTRRGTSILAATEYYSYNTGSGGLYIRSNVFESIKEILPFPEFEKSPGIYDTAILVSLTIPDSSKVYFTEDGTMPTKLATEYSGPITINKNKLIKAIAISNDEKQSKVNTGEFKIKTTTSVAVSNINGDVTIYPTLVNDRLTVSLPSQLLLANISIYSLNGVLVYFEKISLNYKEIDISKLIKGIYAIKIITGKIITTKKIVKL